jgi:hypothetical protein
VNLRPGYHFRISTGVEHTSAKLDAPVVGRSLVVKVTQMLPY